MIKTKKEIILIKRAAKISNSCIKVIKKSLSEDITEQELARRVRREIVRHGATLAFQTLVGTGNRSGMIHTRPHTTERKISGIGYIDFGARYKGYTSDVTVPFIKGKISKKEREAADLVIHAHNLAVRAVKIGEPCWQLYAKIDRFFRIHGYKMGHALGHGIGLQIHERPIIGAPSKPLQGTRKKKWLRIKKITFKPGMIFTIEPGIYTKKFGCRIENDFLLLKNKLVRLTNSELITIK